MKPSFLGKKEKAEDTMQLIQDCIAGVQKAQYKLFREYYSDMMNVCLRYAGNREEAEDMLNEGFVKIFQNLNKYTDQNTPRAWMKRVMANAAIDYNRKYNSHRFEQVPYDDLNENDLYISAEHAILHHLTRGELMDCIQALPYMSRQVFNLYIFENYSHADIAQMLNIKEGTSHWHLNHARTLLKTALQKRGIIHSTY
jgi:RNA polymerase sigma-70 factor (ECF subfamily)